MSQGSGHGSDNYDDIINLPHHVSHKRPRMSMLERAAQFAPFAALTGYDSAIDETARLTDKFTELSEGDKLRLDTVLATLQERINEHPNVEIEFFKPDKRKSGGAYTTLSASLKSIDTIMRTITLSEGTRIGFDTITRIEVL